MGTRVETALLRELKAPGTRVVETNVFGRFDAGEGGALIDAHCLLSRWCAYKWRAWGGAAALAKEMHVLPNPVDPVGIGRVSDACRDALREKLGVPPGRFLFGRIGQPHPAKWSPRMLEAFADVLARGHDVGLMLVGAPPDVIAALDRLPDPVRTRIVTLPVTASDRRISEYLTAMDGFLHVSRIGESFGMVLCEAMLCGVPVVTLSTPLKDNSQLEVVGHRMGGLVALTPDALPEAMIALIGDADLRGPCPCRGRRVGSRALRDGSGQPSGDGNLRGAAFGRRSGGRSGRRTVAGSTRCWRKGMGGGRPWRKSPRSDSCICR